MQFKCKRCEWCLVERVLTLHCDCGCSDHKAIVYVEPPDEDDYQARAYINSTSHFEGSWLKRLFIGIKFILFNTPINDMDIILCQGQMEKLAEHLKSFIKK